MNNINHFNLRRRLLAGLTLLALCLSLLAQGCLPPTPIVHIITATFKPTALPTRTTTPEPVTLADLVTDKDLCSYMAQTRKNAVLSGTLQIPQVSTCRKIENDVRCSAALVGDGLSLPILILAGEGANTMEPLLGNYAIEDFKVVTNNKTIAVHNDPVTISGLVLISTENTCALAVHTIVKK